MAWVWLPSTAGDAPGVEDDSVQVPRTVFSNQMKGYVLTLHKTFTHMHVISHTVTDAAVSNVLLVCQPTRALEQTQHIVYRCEHSLQSTASI
jgi:hypothetical protein